MILVAESALAAVFLTIDKQALFGLQLVCDVQERVLEEAYKGTRTREY